MISIEGHTYRQVFETVANHPEFSEVERAEAQTIAEDLAADDDRKVRVEAAENEEIAFLRANASERTMVSVILHEAVLEEIYAAHPVPRMRYAVEHPVSDTRVFEVFRKDGGSGLRFVVKPYTTGNAMNVGVDSRWARTKEAV